MAYTPAAWCMTSATCMTWRPIWSTRHGARESRAGSRHRAAPARAAKGVSMPGLTRVAHGDGAAAAEVAAADAADSRRLPRLVSGRPRAVYRRLATQREPDRRVGARLFGRLRVRDADCAGHRQAVSAADAQDEDGHLGGDRESGLLAGAAEAESVPDHAEVCRAVDRLEADARQYLRAQGTRPARRGRGAVCARPDARDADGRGRWRRSTTN